MVYILDKLVGMPAKVLGAYERYFETMKINNAVVGGVGRPYARRCGIPQGFPSSMMIVALIMEPWIKLMLSMGGSYGSSR